MAETTNTAAPKMEVPPKIEVTVARNNTRIDFVKEVKKRGKAAGDNYLKPLIPEFKLPDGEIDYARMLNHMITFIGAIDSYSQLEAKFNLIAQGWSSQATDEKSGRFDMDKFIEFAEKFSKRGETIRDLTNRLNQLVDELTKIDAAKPDAFAKFKTITSEMKDIKDSIDNRKRTKEDEEEEETKPTPVVVGATK